MSGGLYQSLEEVGGGEAVSTEPWIGGQRILESRPIVTHDATIGRETIGRANVCRAFDIVRLKHGHGSCANSRPVP